METIKTENEFLKLLQSAVDEYGTQSALAEAMGVTPQYLGDVLHGRRAVSEKVAEFLGHKRVVLFVVPDERERRQPDMSREQK